MRSKLKAIKRREKIFIDVGSADNLSYLHGQAAISEILFWEKFLAQVRRSLISVGGLFERWFVHSLNHSSVENVKYFRQ